MRKMIVVEKKPLHQRKMAKVIQVFNDNVVGETNITRSIKDAFTIIENKYGATVLKDLQLTLMNRLEKACLTNILMDKVSTAYDVVKAKFAIIGFTDNSIDVLLDQMPGYFKKTIIAQSIAKMIVVLVMNHKSKDEVYQEILSPEVLKQALKTLAIQKSNAPLSEVPLLHDYVKTLNTKYYAEIEASFQRTVSVNVTYPQQFFAMPAPLQNEHTMDGANKLFA